MGAPEPTLAERTMRGLHDAVFPLLTRYASPPARLVDLGAGTGAWAKRLVAAGSEVSAVERDVEGFGFPGVRLMKADLNDDFAHVVDGPFRVATAIEVIEHLENPRHFLRECRKLLSSDGILLVTTPNIECVPGRLRFLVNGRFRMFDRDPALNDPTHISPIQTFMFERMIAATGFSLVHHGFNNDRAQATRPSYRLLSSLVTPLLGGVKGGDIHVFVLRPA